MVAIMYVKCITITIFMLILLSTRLPANLQLAPGERSRHAERLIAAKAPARGWPQVNAPSHEPQVQLRIFWDRHAPFVLRLLPPALADAVEVVDAIRNHDDGFARVGPHLALATPQGLAVEAL